MIVQAKQKILFIGDSITESGRQGSSPYGFGYVSMVYNFMVARYPEANFSFVNKGIGGNTIRDLDKRWEQDVIAEKPDWLSVMIGINDVWGLFGNKDVSPVPIAEFQATTRRLLQRVKAATKAQIILAEPYMIETDHNNPMRQMMDIYGKTLAGMAPEFNARVVHTQAAWDTVLAHSTPSFWATDHIHPNVPGHAVIAQAFLRVLEFSL